MDDDQGSGRERTRSGLPTDDIVYKVRRALAAQDARQDAIDIASLELRPGDVPEGWPFTDTPLHAIRAPLREAEALLRKMVDVTAEDEIFSVPYPQEIERGLNVIDREALHGAVIEQVHRRLNASWSYIDIVSSRPLIDPGETPLLFMVTLPLGKQHRGHMVVGEEHNQSGIHFHYVKLDGKRSDILFAFGNNAPEPEHPVKWERHARSKAKFHAQPEIWNRKKRENINSVCCAARDDMPKDMRFFIPSKESQFLLPM